MAIKKHVHILIELLRPFTLLAPLLVSSGVMIASFAYYHNEASFVSLLPIILCASFSLALLNGASNALNQATDYKEDKASKSYRPIPKGLLTPGQAIYIACATYLIAIILSLTVHVTFFLFVLLITFFTVSYSIKPRMKKHLLWNQLWVAIPRGLLGILASWSVFGNPFEQLPLIIGSIAALYLFGGTTTKDILDAKADEQSNVRTMVNVFGIRFTAGFAFLCMGGAFSLILPLIILGYLETYLVPLALLIICSFIIFHLMRKDTQAHRHENTRAWMMMYATYFVYALGFALLTILFA